MSESRKLRKREDQLAITVSPEEKEVLKNTAFENGMTFSAWARMQLLKEAKKTN